MRLSYSIQQSETFTQSLISLLKSYSSIIDSSPDKISSFSLIPRLNTPLVVLNQLEISLKHLAHEYPRETKYVIEKLWAQPFFEPKKLSIVLLSNLPKKEKEYYFEKISSWVHEEIEDPLINAILENAISNKDIFSSTEWFSLVEKWLYSKTSRLRKIGLASVKDLISIETYSNLPAIFHLVEPLLSKPNVSINKDLTALVRSLVDSTQPETAAFLIHLSVMYPKPEVFALIRKCIPFFDDNYAFEIKQKLVIR